MGESSDGQVVCYVASLLDEVAVSTGSLQGANVSSTAAQRFHSLMVKALLQGGVRRIETVTAVPMSRSISRKVAFRRQTVRQDGLYITKLAFWNLPYLRQCSLFVGAWRSVAVWLRQHPSGFVFIDVLCTSVALGALLASRGRRGITIGVVTDVPGVRASTRQKRSRTLHRLGTAASRYGLRFYDGFVLLTEAMNTVVNVKNRPFVVVEAIADPHLRSTEELALMDRLGDHRLVYTGSTHRVYGILTLVEAFRRAHLDGWQLHIYGSGDSDTELRAISDMHHDIIFHGPVTSGLSLAAQREADLLINPRPIGEEYTRYSFPSKNMEYMTSGRPVLSARLPGMPNEYYRLMHLVDCSSAHALACDLRRVTGLPKSERDAIGRRARRYVLTHKTPDKQGAKLRELMDTVASPFGFRQRVKK